MPPFPGTKTFSPQIPVIKLIGITVVPNTFILKSRPLIWLLVAVTGRRGRQ